MANAKAKVADETTAEEQKPAEMVLFRDAFHFEVRTITPQDWAKAGVQEGKLLHWHQGNNFRIPRSEFDFLTEAEFAAYILADPRLVLVTE